MFEVQCSLAVSSPASMNSSLEADWEGLFWVVRLSHLYVKFHVRLPDSFDQSKIYIEFPDPLDQSNVRHLESVCHRRTWWRSSWNPSSWKMWNLTPLARSSENG